MAIAGALCALVAAAVSLTALPALLVLLGRRVDALAPFGPWRPAPEGASRGFWYRLSRLVMRRPVLFAVTTSAVLVLVGLPFARVAFTGVDARVLPVDAGPRIVADAIDTEFPPGPTEPLLVAVDAPRSAAGAVGTYADGLRGFESVAAVGEPRSLDGATWLVEVVPSAPALDERTLTLVEDVRAARAPGPVSVGGTPAGFVDQQAGMADRLPLALAILALTTVVLLFAMTGSVILPLKALVMNALTLSAAFGVLVLVFQDGRLEGLLDYTSQGALNSTQPLVLLCLAYGLSTDYAVFLLHRIKEERDAGASNEEAVALGLERTGRVVTAAALLFCVAIGAFATSEIVFIKQLGLGTAVAVIIDATIVRALLVPSLMRLLGEWNWWAPRPLRRLRVSPPSAASSGT
jgi:RND superfamily putative drug exporter